MNLLQIANLNQSDLSIHFYKSNLNINVIKYNDHDYLSLSQLSKIFLFNDEVAVKDNYLQYNDEELIFSEFSFFCVYRSNTQMRVAQMSYLPIKINGELYIPIKQFLEAMNSLNLINSYISKKNIIDIIDFSIFEKVINSKNENNKNNYIHKLDKAKEKASFNLKPKIVKKYHEFLFEFDSSQTDERGKYIIPPSIKK